jgi:hypothetical protein
MSFHIKRHWKRFSHLSEVNSNKIPKLLRMSGHCEREKIVKLMTEDVASIAEKTWSLMLIGFVKLWAPCCWLIGPTLTDELDFD